MEAGVCAHTAQFLTSCEEEGAEEVVEKEAFERWRYCREEEVERRRNEVEAAVDAPTHATAQGKIAKSDLGP